MCISESLFNEKAKCYDRQDSTSHDIILLNNLEEEVMSAMIMYYNSKGAIIVTDSRETKGLEVKNNCQKIFYNENIIIGIIGLYENNNINFKNIISNELLNGKSIEEILKEKIVDKKLKDLIPENQRVTVFYAKQDGEVGVYDIYSNKELINLINKNSNSDLFKNIPNNIKPLFNGLCERYAICSSEDEPIEYENMFKFSMKQIIRFEEELEKETGIKSAIGGEVQFATIKFKK